MAVQIGYKATQIYKFGSKTDGNSSMKDVLGGKGANLAEMSSLGLPVPPGFTIPCSACMRYHAVQSVPSKLAVFQASLWDQVVAGVSYLEESFGYMPLVSVRSGARVSMPGMMDTILNVGLTTSTLDFWSKKLGERAALDSYRRLIQMYGSVAMDVDMALFEDALESIKASENVSTDSELSAKALKTLSRIYRAIVKDTTGHDFPDTLNAQLRGAIGAVFRSWNNPRAISYRQINGIPGEWGTAVTIQSMVFGNMNDASCTGVVFTRCPSTGVHMMTGEFLVNAQGEDVVAGVRNPLAIAKLWDWNKDIGNDLEDALVTLETHYKDMQDVEFTVQDSKLYLLQTRNGKRSAMAAFQVAHDLAVEGVITKEEAVSRVSQAQLLSAMSDTIDPAFKVKPDFMGIAAGGGVVTGVAVFTAENAVNCKTPCVLVTKETDPDDIAGMNASVGILTATGGLTSHAAVVARGMNKSCVVGATDLSFNNGLVTYSGDSGFIAEGSMVTIDGATGRVWVNTKVPVVSAANNSSIKSVVSWAAGSGVIDRVTISGRSSALEIMQQAEVLTGRVQIDTASLDMPDKGETYDLMMVLGEGLAKSKVEVVYIDTAGIDTHLSKSDEVFDWVFGAVKQPEAVATEKYKAMKLWDVDLLKKVVVKGGAHDSTYDIEALASKGVKFTGKVKTFADLINADGPIEVDAEVVLKVFGTAEAYELAKSLVENSTGKKLSGNAVTAVYWYDLLTYGKAA